MVWNCARVIASLPLATPSAVFKSATYAFTASCTSAAVSVAADDNSAISEFTAPMFAAVTPVIAALL